MTTLERRRPLGLVDSSSPSPPREVRPQAPNDGCSRWGGESTDRWSDSHVFPQIRVGTRGPSCPTAPARVHTGPGSACRRCLKRHPWPRRTTRSGLFPWGLAACRGRLPPCSWLPHSTRPRWPSRPYWNGRGMIDSESPRTVHAPTLIRSLSTERVPRVLCR